MRRSAVAALFFLVSATTVPAADIAYERAVDTALTASTLPQGIVGRARDRCDTALCFAEALTAALPDRVRLEPVRHPDTDSIRWVDTAPSVIATDTGNAVELQISHFGRKAVSELQDALTGAGQRPVHIGLGGNEGGDFERMLEIAGLLIGSRRDAITIDYGDRIEQPSIDGPPAPSWEIARVETDEQTASAALVLARLLAAHTSAEMAGPLHPGRPLVLKHRISIDHHWRLILPVADIEVTEP